MYLPPAVQIFQKHLGLSAYGCMLNKVLEVVVALQAQWNWEVPCWRSGKHFNEQQSLKKEDCSLQLNPHKFGDHCGSNYRHNILFMQYYAIILHYHHNYYVVIPVLWHY